MSEPVLKERVLDALKHVKGPNLSGDIVSLGLVSEVVIRGGKVYFAISVDPARATELEALRKAAEKVVKDLPGVDAVAVTLTADRQSGSAPAGGNGAGVRAPASPASPVARATASALGAASRPAVVKSIIPNSASPTLSPRTIARGRIRHPSLLRRHIRRARPCARPNSTRA